MKLDEILKLNGEVITEEVLEKIIDSEYCTWFEKEDDCCYMTLYSPLANFESEKIKVYL